MADDPRGATYEIVLRGEIGDRLAALFEGMTLEHAGGNTVLTGPVRDQAQLHGLIERAQESGIELVAVNRLDTPPKPDTTRSHETP